MVEAFPNVPIGDGIIAIPLRERRGAEGGVVDFKSLLLVMFLLASTLLQAQIDLIPKPEKIESIKGSVTLYNGMSIFQTKQNIKGTELLRSLFDPVAQFNIDTIVFSGRTSGSDEMPGLVIDLDSSLGKDEYRVFSHDRGLSISAGGEEGMLYGVTTFYQVYQLEGKKVSNGIEMPFFKIQDRPKFPHRGLLLDCSRHFFSVETVKKYIDLLALYKMNVLHWHLTEDQGWRIQIDKYPKLTEVGAWRTEKDGSRYGGFYTKDEIREVVAYATNRGITVIPEIELPGHSQAAVASYPWLSCTGEQVEVANDWGVFKEIYCAGNDSVFAFLEDVLAEVMDLFPSNYIHIGGDEAPKYRWEHCAKCQRRIVKEELKDEHELQSYFITRIEKFLNKNGRQLIGWDEILEGGLSPNATVQSWRGMEHGKHAAEMKHNVIMSPTSHCYLDYGLDAINLERVYRFNPIPEGLEAEFEEYILGGEVNMWTEHVPNDSVLDSKVFPRLIAMAELLWNGPGGDFNDFYDRLQTHYPILQQMGVEYGLEAEPIQVRTFVKHGRTFVEITPGLPDLTVEYSPGDMLAHSYEKPFELTKTMDLQVMAFKNGEMYGEIYQTDLIHHKGLGKKVDLSEYSKYYPAGGDYGLNDGLLGTFNFRDGRWMGFSGNDAVIEMDLGKEQSVTSVGVNFYEYPNAWIMLPKDITIYASEDGRNWKVIKSGELGGNPKDHPGDKQIMPLRINFEEVKTRFIKVVATNFGTLPEWHDAAGSDAWIFVDEIVVR